MKRIIPLVAVLASCLDVPQEEVYETPTEEPFVQAEYCATDDPYLPALDSDERMDCVEVVTLDGLEALVDTNGCVTPVDEGGLLVEGWYEGEGEQFGLNVPYGSWPADECGPGYLWANFPLYDLIDDGVPLMSATLWFEYRLAPSDTPLYGSALCIDQGCDLELDR